MFSACDAILRNIVDHFAPKHELLGMPTDATIWFDSTVKLCVARFRSQRIVQKGKKWCWSLSLLKKHYPLADFYLFDPIQ